MNLMGYLRACLAALGVAHAGMFVPVASPTNLYEQYEAETTGRQPAEIDAQNAAVFAALAQWQPRVNSGRLQGIDAATARATLDDAMKDPVVGLANVKTYDPNGQLGFCFGRAMYLHLDLLQRGVDKGSIFKAFVIGPMKYENIDWQFHVATVVRSTEGGWIVIDPEYRQVLSLEEWFKKNASLSTDKKLRLYVTEAKKFGASAPAYTEPALQDPWYNGYFKDMLARIRTRLAARRPQTCQDLFAP